MGWPLQRLPEITHVEVIEKVWGREHVITNNDCYCGKILEIDSGGCSSIHYHPLKDETFYILEGSCYFWLGKDEDDVSTLVKGDIVRLRPNTIHGFACFPGMKPCRIIEISTPHSDEDVVRLVPSKKLT
jgi:quercetin dioxygenase-like cupin family protein